MPDIPSNQGKMDLDAAYHWWMREKYIPGEIVCADTHDSHVTAGHIINNLFQERIERKAELDLMAAFDAAKDAHPHLLIEIGYTRITDWMVHVWDAHGTSIANAPKIISAQSPDRGEACREATEKLRALSV